jgi:2-polyprenyl-6-methoxyphenol hydroxylase-like FAD-dependent oxidoreductase
MTPPLETDVDVLVVGAGPTGMTVAISLLSQGHRRVSIVDRAQEGDKTSRAAVVYPGTLEVLEPLGVAVVRRRGGWRAQHGA